MKETDQNILHGVNNVGNMQEVRIEIALVGREKFIIEMTGFWDFLSHLC